MRHTLEEMANQLGESVKSVSRGVELSAAAVFGGLSRKAGEPGVLQRVIEQAVRTPSDAVVFGVQRHQFDDPGSPVISGSHRFLTSLFGGRQATLLNAIAREAGLKTGAAASILAVGTQWVLSFIGNRVREDGMTANSLASLLRAEGPGLRQALPAEIVEDLAPVTAAGRRGMSYLAWLVPLAVLLAFVLWLVNRPERTPRITAPVVTTAETAISTLGAMVPRRLSDGTILHIPERGVEGRLLTFIESPSRMVDKTTWFDFDRLLFNFGSSTLQPQSREQLLNIAAILKSHPNVHLKIGGYTDNVGSPSQNMALSQERASRVRNELVQLGVAADRLTAQGYGEQHPIGDNAIEAGRARNRRVSMLVTQK
jgi:outer membrane protein OmpA-like peptidoglycan-associated protein